MHFIKTAGILLAVILLSSTLHSQTRQDLDAIENKISQLNNEIELLTDTLNFAKKAIKELESSIILKEFYNQEDNQKAIYAILTKNVELRSKRSTGMLISKLSKGDSIRLIYFDTFHWQVLSKHGYGQMYHASLVSTPLIESFKIEWEDLNNVNKSRNKNVKFPTKERVYSVMEISEILIKEAHQASLLESEDKQKRQRLLEYEQLIKNYGQSIGNKLFRGDYWVGMSDIMVIESLGRPLNVSETILHNQIKQEWVYSDKHLYFENGILTTIQR